MGLSQEPKSASMTMIDQYDASHDRLRLAVARAFKSYADKDLLDALRDPEPIVRTAAARELHIRGGRLTFDTAVQLVQHPRFDFREIGAFVLGQLGTPKCPFATETLPMLNDLLSDSYHEVRTAAVGAIGFLASLGHQPTTEIVTQLKLACEDVEPSVRAASALAMGMLHTKVAKDILTTMADDKNAQVRDFAKFGLELHMERKAKGSRKARETSGLSA
jgi:HEAT repeat protein